MEYNKRQEEYKLIAALLHDIHMSNAVVFNTKSLRNTLKQVEERIRFEGISFLTKTLPKLGKALDKALTLQLKLNATSLMTAKSFEEGSELPIFMEEFFSLVFDKSGVVLNEPCVRSVIVLRQVLYLFYKYELPYTVDQEREVVLKFVKTEADLAISDAQINRMVDAVEYNIRNSIPYPSANKVTQIQFQATACTNNVRDYSWTGLVPITDLDWTIAVNAPLDGTVIPFVENDIECYGPDRYCVPFNDYKTHEFSCVLGSRILRRARLLLARALGGLDVKDIAPKHGPGSVATKQLPWEKYQWSNVSYRLREHFPLDAFFYASGGHVCDCISEVNSLPDKDLPARVILVPKDSRGPRLISCEPVDFQWIQQGIMRKLVQRIETSWQTKFNVFFTDQEPNRRGAQLGSIRGGYATLDLNEASDRVSLDLVRALFPSHIFDVIKDCRTQSTRLPDGSIIPLRKFAPMGSALCFPILALTVWAILTAGAPDKNTRESILVYGDDVIVPTAHAANAIEQLELFGLKVNRDKSCTSGFFRESCGMDAFYGVDVTPVRFRTVWSSVRSPDTYTSWIAYANSMFDKRYFATYELITGWLFRLYGEIPCDDMHLACPSLREVPSDKRPKQTRINPSLQKREWKVWDVKSRPIKKEIKGWEKLLRFFSESGEYFPPSDDYRPWSVRHTERATFNGDTKSRSSVGSYTLRRASMLVRRWR
jgi:hypothetical protein